MKVFITNQGEFLACCTSKRISNSKFHKKLFNFVSGGFNSNALPVLVCIDELIFELKGIKAEIYYYEFKKTAL